MKYLDKESGLLRESLNNGLKQDEIFRQIVRCAIYKHL